MTTCIYITSWEISFDTVSANAVESMLARKQRDNPKNPTICPGNLSNLRTTYIMDDALSICKCSWETNIVKLSN